MRRLKCKLHIYNTYIGYLEYQFNQGQLHYSLKYHTSLKLLFYSYVQKCHELDILRQQDPSSSTTYAPNHYINLVTPELI